jgi:hypothetical protein
MTLAANGQMNVGGNTANRSINLELGRAYNAQSSLGESALRALAGVPSGAIRLGADFYGKANFNVAYSGGFGNNYFVEFVFFAGGSPAGIGIRWNSNGTMDQFSYSTGYTNLGETWASPTTSGAGSNYWIRFTRTATTGPSATLYSTASTGWLQLNSGREIVIQKSNVTVGMSATYTVEISSDSGGATILTTRTGITLNITDGTI